MAKNHEVIPSARRMVKSLRDVGYDFSSAVADLVDNSIEAGATKVDITAEFDGDDSYVIIADNGRGMSDSQLVEAMRYGSSRDYSEEDLGKFGLGLKTASLSQCQFFAVASKSKPRGKIFAYYWDINHIQKTDKWQIIPLKDKRWMGIVSGLLKDKTGTVVLWRQLDRILGYEHPYSDSARKRMQAMCRELEMHLAMVFHRFLFGEVPRRKKVEIILNGNNISPWDPFVRKTGKTQALTVQKLTIEHEGVKGEVILEPYILPPQQDFPSLLEHRLAGGPYNWNQQQGFYIYRAGRLIQSGGWSRLRTPDEHTKLARVAVSFSPILDNAFKIDVAKMKVQIPSAYHETFDKAIQPIVKLARERYDKTERAASRRAPQSASTSSVSPATNPPSAQGINPDAMSIPTQQFWTLDEIEEKALAIANSLEKIAITRVFERLRKKLGVTN